jgi:hypothetical protein
MYGFEQKHDDNCFSNGDRILQKSLSLKQSGGFSALCRVSRAAPQMNRNLGFGFVVTK